MSGHSKWASIKHKKGTGEGADAAAIESVVYEGYGPGGVAILVEALTDNRNRTGAGVRHIFGKHAGTLGEPGSVAYLFEKRGVVVVDASRWSEDDLEPAIDAGAQDIVADADIYEVVCDPGDLVEVRAALEDAGVEIQSAEVVQRPTSRVPVDEADVGQLLRLLEALEADDDVTAVHANFDAASDVLERVAAAT